MYLRTSGAVRPLRKPLYLSRNPTLLPTATYTATFLPREDGTGKC